MTHWLRLAAWVTLALLILTAAVAALFTLGQPYELWVRSTIGNGFVGAFVFFGTGMVLLVAVVTAIFAIGYRAVLALEDATYGY